MLRPCIGFWLALLCVLGGGQSLAAPARPNVLFILVDSIGWGDLAAEKVELALRLTTQALASRKSLP